MILCLLKQALIKSRPIVKLITTFIIITGKNNININNNNNKK